MALQFRSAFGAAVLILSASAAGGCGRATRSPHGEAAGAGMGAVGGSVGAGGAASASVTAEPPLQTRHALIGSPGLRGCITSVVETPNGLAVAGVANSRAASGMGAFDRVKGWSWTSEQPSTAGGAAVVFGDMRGRVLAWSDSTTGVLTLELFGTDGQLEQVLETDATDKPVAGAGWPGAFAVVLISPDKRLSLATFVNGALRTVSLETEPCAVESSLAIGIVDDNPEVAYYCRRYVAPEFVGALVTSRVDSATLEVERTELDVAVGPRGTPGVTRTAGGFLFVHQTPEGATVLTRTAPDTGEASTQEITGLPAFVLGRDDENPTFSVAETRDAIVLTRSVCNRHEDDSPTGTVDVCRVELEQPVAVCSQEEAPCWTAKVVPTDSGPLLLGCAPGSTAALVPIALGTPPTALEPLFPLGFTALSPLSLDCDGYACSALTAVDSAEVTTGHDRRLAFMDVVVDDGCDVPTCRARALTPTSVFAASDGSPSLQPSIAVERQHAGLPLAVLTTVRGEGGIQPELALLGPSGVVFRQSVPRPSGAIFATPAVHRVFWSELFGEGLWQVSVAEGATTAEPVLAILTGGELPSMARCGDRLLVHARRPRASTLEPPVSAVFALDLNNSAVTALFDPGVLPEADSRNPPRIIGCAGERVFLLDGKRVRRFTAAGEREADIELATPADATTPRLTPQLDSLGNYALLTTSSAPGVVDALLLYSDGSTRSFTLPLPNHVTPAGGLIVAPDHRDGWLRALYATTNGEIIVSTWQLLDRIEPQ